MEKNKIKYPMTARRVVIFLVMACMVLVLIWRVSSEYLFKGDEQAYEYSVSSIPGEVSSAIPVSAPQAELANVSLQPEVRKESFNLSPEASKLLKLSQETAYEQMKLRKLEAQVAVKEQQDKLDGKKNDVSLNQSSMLPVPQQFYPPLSDIPEIYLEDANQPLKKNKPQKAQDNIKLLSVVKSANGESAVFELDGSLVSVNQGATFFDGFTVLSIEKNSVVIRLANGKEKSISVWSGGDK